MATTHSAKCISSAFRCAVENQRDAGLPYDGPQAVDWAGQYLADGTKTCECEDITKARYEIEYRLVAAEAELEELEHDYSWEEDPTRRADMRAVNHALTQRIERLRGELKDADEVITEIVNAEYERSNREEREEFWALQAEAPVTME